MAGNSGAIEMEVTGHNRESAARVVHYLRGVKGPEPGSFVEIQAAIIVTDDKNIVADGTRYNVTATAEPAQ